MKENLEYSTLVNYDFINDFLLLNPQDDLVTTKIMHIKEWLYKRLCNGHPELGRNGPVCPYTKRSVKQKLFWFSFYLEEKASLDKIHDFILELLEKFIASYQESNDEIYRTYVVLFPKMKSNETNLIDNVHKLLKPIFVSKGIMLGQFHENCNIGGVHNHEFKALYTPLPLLVIRNMVINDYILLKDDKTSVDAYIKFCSKKYGDEFINYYNNLNESSM